MRRAERNSVFGYGSLLRPAVGKGDDAAVVCHLTGFHRAWDVAMDNRSTIPGYKYYVDRATGRRPAVYVTFLSISPDPRRSLNGVVYPVEAAILPLLDERERNYERREVTGLVDADVSGPVWAYVGTADARERYRTGSAEGTACVSDEYYETVRDGFRRLRPSALDEFDRTTDALQVPRRALRRVDVPPGIDAPVEARRKRLLTRGVV
jgi:cation transport regulator ChaC